jgi:hypothetical protein
MAVYSGVHAALKSIILEVWPEAATNGVYHSFTIATVSWESQAQAGKIPLAVVEYDLRSSGDGPASLRRFEGEVLVYFCADKGISPDVLFGKLEDLATHVGWGGDTHSALTNAYAEVLPLQPWIDFSPHLLVNQHFLSSGRPFYCGAVRIPLVIEVP